MFLCVYVYVYHVYVPMYVCMYLAVYFPAASATLCFKHPACMCVCVYVCMLTQLHVLIHFSIIAYVCVCLKIAVRHTHKMYVNIPKSKQT
jgi:hypothetical protein